jgi:hypothetical protein
MTPPNNPGQPTFVDVGAYTVTVNWTVPKSGATSYKLERAPYWNGPFIQLVTGLTSHSYVDTAVAANLTYWYQVRATNAAGLDGAYSALAGVTTARDPGIVVPGAPGPPTYSNLTATSLYVSWTAAAGAVSYKVERAPNASGSPGTWTPIASGVTSLNYLNSALTANTAYWYRVRATNAGGDGPYTAASSVLTLPNAPGTPTFSNVAYNTVTVGWAAPTGGAASFRLERGTEQYGPWTAVATGVTALNYADATVAGNRTYWYRVGAANSTGSNYSSSISVTTPADPGIPVPGVPGTPSYTSVSNSYLYVNWTAAAGAVSYKVERAPNASGSPGTWTPIASGVTSLNYLNSALTANTAYWYRVRATNAGGDGPYTAASSVLTLP